MNSFTIITSTLLLLLFFPSIISAADGSFNITKVLSKYSYNTFNDLLSETHLAEEINNRKTITILAVQDGSISSVSSKSHEVAKRILATHVLLDFYDMKKLKNPGNNSITTLFQTTGMATSGQGYLHLKDEGNNQFKVGSAANKGGETDVSINKVVFTQGYLLSVLDVSGVINVPGIENIHAGPAHSPKKAGPAHSPRKMLTPASAPGPDHPDHEKNGSPSPAGTPAETPAESDAPSSSDDDGSAPAPAKSGAVKVICDIKCLAGLMVFLMACILF